MNIINLLSSKEKTLLNIKSISKGTTLFHEKDYCNEVGFIIKGSVEIISYSTDGQEDLISAIEENDAFGNALIFTNNPIYLGEVIAKEDSTIGFVTKENLVYLLQTNQLFLEAYINQISKKTIELNRRNKLLAHKSIRSRIIFYCELHNNCISISVTQLAHDLILPRPSVSREINKMLNEDILEKKGKCFYLK